MPKVKKERELKAARVQHYFDLTGMEEPLEAEKKTKKKAKLPTHSNENASLVDWCDVSDDDSWTTLHTNHFFEPSWEIPKGWTMIKPNVDKKDGIAEPWIYEFKEFDVRVRGCKNMWEADRKIAKWKTKYKKHDQCKYCRNAPCALEDMRELLRDEGYDLTVRSDVHSSCVHYRLYRVAARNYFGFLGWGNQKKLPKCIVAFILKEHPKGYDEDYTDFIKYNKFHNGTWRSW